MTGRAAFCATLLCATSFPLWAQAQAMILISTSPSGRELLVDRSSLKTVPPRAGYRSFAAAQVRAEIRSPGGRRSGRVTERVHYSFNCTQRTVATLAYYRGDASGRRSHDWTAADYSTRYDPVKPGTAVEIAMAYACSGGKLPLPPGPEQDLPPSVDED